MSPLVPFAQLSRGLGTADPQAPAARLAAIDTRQLRLAGDDSAAVAVALSAGSSTGQVAIGQLTHAWSAQTPRVGVAKLLHTADGTAAMLQAQAAAIDTACTVIQQAKSNGELDAVLANAELDTLKQNTWADAVAGVVGIAQIGSEVQVAAIFRRLVDALNGRLRNVDVALTTLSSALIGDPTAGPDGLRGGPNALLQPDPVMNPAHRTDLRNRATLAADLHSGDPRLIKFAMSILASVQRAGGHGTAQLLVYDPNAFGGQGRAAISVGDLTTATDVAIVVPGISNSPSSMSGGIDLAADLRDEADRQAPGGHTAVVAWYGYDIPLSFTKESESGIGTDLRDTIAAGSAANASSGAPQLAADLVAFKAMSQSSTRTTVIGFSMGSTTVSEAARFDLPVDSVVLLGSPGAGWDTRTASGYRNVPASDVYSLSYDQDPVTLPVTDRLAADAIGIADPYGPDPASEAFGGNHIDATTNVPLIAGTGLFASVLRVMGDPRHHTMQNYMQGRALQAEGSIVVGRKDRVPIKRGR